MRTHVRAMAITYLTGFLILFLLRTAGVDFLNTEFFESVKDACWGGGIALVAALFFGPKEGA